MNTARERLAYEVKKYDAGNGNMMGMADAARDLLNAEREEELPWKVEAPGAGVVASFKRKHLAKDYVHRSNWLNATITGPDDDPPAVHDGPPKVNHADYRTPVDTSKWDALDTPAPRLVEVEWPSRYADLANDSSLQVRELYAEWLSTQPDPIKPTVANLLPGMIAEVNGRLSICTKQFALVDLVDGGHHSPTSDTPITGKVWRWEVDKQDREGVTDDKALD